MSWLTENTEALVTLVVAVHAVALIIVNLTPTPKDDEKLAKVYKVVEKFAGVITRKAKATSDKTT